MLTVGGGMGDTPSMPTEESAHQPAVLFQYMALEEGEQISILNDKNETIFSYASDATLQDNLSLVSIPEFKLGASYTLKWREKSIPFTFTSNVLKQAVSEPAWGPMGHGGPMGGGFPGERQ